MLAISLALVLLCLAARVVYLLYLHPLSKIPGPHLWIISRLPYAWTLRQGHFAIRMTELHAKYGPIVRIASNEVSFINQDAWPEIFSYQTNFNKSPHWYRARPNGSYGIVAAPNPDHARFRRTFAPAFTEKAVREREPMVVRHVDILVQELKKETSNCKNDKSIDFLKWLEYITLDIIGDLCFSESFDCLVNDENHEAIDALQVGMKAFTYAVIPRVLGVEVAWTWVAAKFSALNRIKFFKHVHYLTHKRLAEGETVDKNDLMTFVCRRTEGKGLSIPEAENALGDFLIAGSETVATTLAALFYHLVRDPQINQRLTDEVRQSFENEFTIGGKELLELPFLDAVVKEAMRLGPSLPSAMPRIVPEPGANVCGYWFPPGSLLSFSQLAAHSSPTNFSSPEKFIPSRWLPESTMQTHNTEVFQPFSVGPRHCIGKMLAYLEVKLIVARILWNFDISSGGNDWEWNSQKTYLIWEKKPLLMRLTPTMH